jgi:hypothetical protein
MLPVFGRKELPNALERTFVSARMASGGPDVIAIAEV